jgi:hypothetical protein
MLTSLLFRSTGNDDGLQDLHHVAFLMAAASVASAFGLDVPGFPYDPLWGIHLLMALGLATTRNAIANK